jgi:hypothetical protein
VDGFAPWPDQGPRVCRSVFPAVPRYEWVLFGNPVLVTHETHTRVF